MLCTAAALYKRSKIRCLLNEQVGAMTMLHAPPVMLRAPPVMLRAVAASRKSQQNGLSPKWLDFRDWRTE